MSGALPPPAARPLGGLSGLATHVPWAPVCGRGGPALFLWLVCPAGGCMPRGCLEALPGGLAFHGAEEHLVSGAVPFPAARPLGRAARVPRPVVPGCRWCGRGTPAPFRGVRSCELSLRAEGVGGGRPRRGALCHCEGRLHSGALPPPAACPLGGLLGSATQVLWCECAGLGAQHCPFGLHALRGATCRGGGGRLSRGGWPSTVVRGFWCQGLSLP